MDTILKILKIVPKEIPPYLKVVEKYDELRRIIMAYLMAIKI